MKILIIGDLHGRKPIIKNENFDAIVLIGDICDDRKIAPFYKEYFKLLRDQNIEEDFDKWIIKKIGKKKLEIYEKKSLVEGNRILKYLDKFNKPMFMVAGNWDQSYGKSKIKDMKDYYNYRKWFYDSWLGDKINPQLARGIRNLKNLMFNCVEFNRVNFIGYGLSSGPEKIKRNIVKEVGKIKLERLKKANKRISNKLSFAYKNRKNKNLPTFFVTHNIPYKTKLDIGKDKNSYAYKKHLGSTIARDFCKKFKPLICVGGHVHEGKGKDKIGETTIINPGYGSRAQVLIEINEKKNTKKINSTYKILKTPFS